MTTLPTQITAMFQDQTINHYNITGVIGEGGQGLVLQLENGDGKTYTGKVIQRRLSLTPYIEEYKPTGNLIYGKELFKNINEKIN